MINKVYEWFLILFIGGTIYKKIKEDKLKEDLKKW